MIYFRVPPTVAKGKCSDTWNIRHSSNICFLLYIINVYVCFSSLLSSHRHQTLHNVIIKYNKIDKNCA